MLRPLIVMVSIIQLKRMPGSYRVLNHILKQPPVSQKAKLERQEESDEELMMEEKNVDVPQGKWTEEQNLKFTIFVHYYQDVFTSKHKRKICKIFKTFAEFMDPRTPTQCRSHYQKMMEKHRSITKLKKYYKTLYGQGEYKRQLEQFKSQWEQNHQPMSVTHPEIKEYRELAVQADFTPTEPQPCSKCSGRGEGVQVGVQAEVQAEGAPFAPLLYWSDPAQMAQLISNGYYLVLMPPIQEHQRNQ